MTTSRKAAAVAALLALLVAHNLVLAVRNQLIFDRWHRIQPQRGDLAEIAAASKNPVTRNTFANYYLLRAAIAGATVELPPEFGGLGWWLRHVARLETERGEARQISDAAFERLAGTGVTRDFRVGKTDHRVHLILAGSGERYVFARRARRSGWLLIAERQAGAEPGADEQKQERK